MAMCTITTHRGGSTNEIDRPNGQRTDLDLSRMSSSQILRISPFFVLASERKKKGNDETRPNHVGCFDAQDNVEFEFLGFGPNTVM